MAHLVVKQPNGKYSCWSTVVDGFIAGDMTADEYIEWRAKRAYDSEKQELKEIFDNEIKYKMCFKDYDECLKMKHFHEAFELGCMFLESQEEE